MAEITYSETDHQGLDLIEPLWEKLNDEHMERSEHFSNHYAKQTFNKRKTELLKKFEFGSMHIGLARDSHNGDLVGYCVSTISKDRQGEIDSIYIEADYRWYNIGDSLMKKTLAWMDANSVTKKIVVVATGNEEIYDFYGRYNFFPARTTLEQVE